MFRWSGKRVGLFTSVLCILMGVSALGLSEEPADISDDLATVGSVGTDISPGLVISREVDSGSGFGGGQCRLSNNDSGERYDISWCSSFGSFVAVVPIPSKLQGGPYDVSRRMLEACATLGVVEEPDPSLRWWLDAVEAARGEQESEEGEGVRSWEISLRWHEGRPEIPEPYSLYMRGEGASKLVEESGLIWCGERPEIDSEAGIWINYHSHNHLQRGDEEPFRTLASSGDNRILATKQGVVLQQSNRYAWIFVSDRIWGGPEKLRFPGVRDGGFIDEEWIWISQSHMPTAAPILGSVWLVDSSSGRTIQVVLGSLDWTGVDGEEIRYQELYDEGLERGIDLEFSWRGEGLDILGTNSDGEVFNASLAARVLGL